MTLRIRKLTVALACGPRHAELRSQVDSAFRSRVPADLGPHLGPALDRVAPVVRIGRLHLRMTIRTADIVSGRLSALWIDCFCKALFQVLAHPDGMAPAGLVRFASRASYLAAQAAIFLRPADPEVYWLRAATLTRFKTPANFARHVTANEPLEVPAMLRELHRLGWLQAFLLTLDELALEELLIAAERLSPFSPGAQSLTRLLHCAVALADATLEQRRPHQWKLDSRRTAVWLWATLSVDSETPGPRQVWLALQALAALILDPSQIESLLVTARGNDAQPHVTMLGEAIAGLARAPDTDLVRHRLLTALQTIAPAQISEVSIESRWIVSNIAGILLFLDQVRRLGWDKRLSPEAFPFVLAAIATELTGQRYRQDPAVFLLAGYPEAFEDRHAAEYFRDHAPAASALAAQGDTWPNVLANAAASLAFSLAQRIRGFRQASLQAVQRNIALRAGRYRVEPDRIVVVLESGPWDVAIHISGVDDALNEVAWLGGRRVEFILEGM